jgi:plastocyanin
MISSEYDTDIMVLGISIVFVFLLISLVGSGNFETQAQGSNVTSNSTNATSGINATSLDGGTSGEVTVVMPLGSSEGSVQTGYDPGYDPYAITVSPGDKVIWDNQDTVVHTATSGNPLTVRPDGKFDTGLVGANQTSKPLTMPTQPGEYRYFCTVHPFLSGTVIIQQEQPGAAQSNLSPPSIQQQRPFIQSQPYQNVPPSQIPFNTIPLSPPSSFLIPPQNPMMPPSSSLPALPPQIFNQPTNVAPRILSENNYVDSYGSLHIVGEVINESYETMNSVQVTATFYDTNNGVVGTSFDYTSPMNLQPGQRAPFDITVSERTMPTYLIASYRLSADHLDFD